MKFDSIFVVTFWCTLYIPEKTTAMREENLVIQPEDEGSNVIIDANTETDTSDMQRKYEKPIVGVKNLGIQSADEDFNDILEEISETVPLNMQNSTNKPISTDEHFDIQPEDEGFSVIIDENAETNSLDIQRKDEKPIFGVENLSIQTADEEFNDILEESSEKVSLYMQRSTSNPISTNGHFSIQPADEGFNVISEKISETVSSDMQRKGKNKKPTSVRNCLDLKQQGKISGTYLIKPCDDTNKVVNVYCDMDTDGGGWTVIQRRDNYYPQEDFYGTWNEYAVGFGNVSRDFWVGNDNIHCLTKQWKNEIRFDLADWSGYTKYAKYSYFYIADEANWYKLNVQNYTGTAGDSFNGRHSNMNFTTYDVDNDIWSGNCAVRFTGAWWYDNCHYSNLNGLYNYTTYAQGLNWYHWKGFYYSLKKTEMKIRPRQ